MIDLLVTDASIIGERGPLDVAVDDGRIVRVAPGLNIDAKRTLRAEGRVLLPPFVDSHVHLDACLTEGRPHSNESGTLLEGIEIWESLRDSLTVDDIVSRGRRVLKWAIAHGTLYVRTHVDVSSSNTAPIRAAVALREEFAHVLTLQVTAFPQSGVFTAPENRDRLEEAVRLGADCVGGIPHAERSVQLGVDSVDLAFEVAARHHKLVDLHCDETDDPQSRFVEQLAAAAVDVGLGSRATASHCTAMGSYDGAYSAKIRRVLATSGVNIVCNPLVNTVLQGRYDSYPKRRGVTQVKELLSAGVNVSLGSDAIVDPWYPLGTADMLTALNMAVHVCHLTGSHELDHCVELATSRGARTLGVEDEYGVAEGKVASFVVLNAVNAREAIRLLPERRWVVSRGNVVASSTAARSRLRLAPGNSEVVSFGCAVRPLVHLPRS